MSQAAETQQWDLVIEAGKTERHYWRDLWSYRELLWFLAWRDILLRYKQTVFGVLWTVVQPVLSMIVFSVVFGRLAKLPSDGVPYPLLVYSAMMPWTFFSETFASTSSSLVGNSGLISKVYFPRLVIPLSRVVVGFVDLMVASVIYVVLMIYYRTPFSYRLLALPGLLLLAALCSMGVGLFVSSMNVKYRDFRYVVPFAVRFGLYVSPVGFSSSVVADQWRFLYSLNPMVGVIDGFRWALLGGQTALYVPGFVLSIVIASGVAAGGIVYFRATERHFADVI